MVLFEALLVRLDAECRPLRPPAVSTPCESLPTGPLVSSFGLGGPEMSAFPPFPEEGLSTVCSAELLLPRLSNELRRKEGDGGEGEEGQGVVSRKVGMDGREGNDDELLYIAVYVSGSGLLAQPAHLAKSISPCASPTLRAMSALMYSLSASPSLG